MRYVFNGRNIVTECPNCGNSEYYVCVIIKGKSSCNYRLDGRDRYIDYHGNEQTVYNGQLYETLTHREQKSAYCNQCYIKLGLVKEV